jgi:hypothetical protein
VIFQDEQDFKESIRMAFDAVKHVFINRINQKFLLQN